MNSKQGQTFSKINTNKKKSYRIYSINNYATALQNFIDNDYEEYTFAKLIKQLQTDNYYHFRAHNATQYIFFGDVDHCPFQIDEIRTMLNTFLLQNYGLSFDENEFKYTINDAHPDSYHYSIPKWNASTEKIKEIQEKFSKQHADKFAFVNNKGKHCSMIDTTVYSEHWFRCPNQSKGKLNEDGKHIIKNGKLCNFIIDYIPKNSVNINDIVAVSQNTEQLKLTKHNEKSKQTDNSQVAHEAFENSSNGEVIVYGKNDMLSTTMTKPELYKKMFDECYKQNRFEEYKYWINVGMAIKNTFNDEDEGVELFNYYSAKGSNYEGFEKTKCKYKTFTRRTKSGYTIATVYYYAIEDNKPKFIEILSKNTFELGQTDICQYLKMIAGHKFLYKITGDNVYRLYCFNGQFWQNDDTIMKKCISTELYNFLKMVLIEVYWNSADFAKLKLKIDKLKLVSFKKDIVETYKEIGVDNNVKFDDKWRLLGFTNCVYDMEEECFREYRYDDYISITTGYDWREPTEDELQTVTKMIQTIMPIEDERNLYLQILSTSIEGRCLEKFIIFNGSGGNGKGVIDDLLVIALGHYALMGNNAILFECSKTGSNPEKANIHKKRLVIFREPSEKHKFENSVVKELTGGGTFSARSHHEKETEKDLHATIIVECNKKPLFTEDPTNAEIRRIIDLYFRSTFTEDTKLLDDTKHIYLANSEYKTKEFQEKHKYALLKILMDEHKKYYKQNNSMLTIPSQIEERTKLYLELSCNIVQWFKDNYEFANDRSICKLKDIFENFISSTYYCNLSKAEKRRYNKTFFVEYFETNVFLKKYFHVYRNVNCIKDWKLIDKDANDNILLV